MAARMVNAIARTIPTVNSNLAGFGIGAMYPSWRQIDVATPDFRGANWKSSLGAPAIELARSWGAVEALMSPDEVIVTLNLDKAARLERDRRQATGRPQDAPGGGYP